jgi:hypothetical protein
MAQSGVNYFVKSYASFDYENDWKIWFDFKNVSTVVNNRSGADPLYSGQIRMFPSTPSPTVMFSENDYLRVITSRNGGVLLSPTTGLWSNNFSLIFLNSKNSLGKNLIYNSLESGIYSGSFLYKGYRIGYTDSNKPFFEYCDNDGMKCMVADFNLPTYHSLSFIKNNNSLSIGYYDFLKQQNFNQTFQVDSDYFLEPSGQYVGYYTNGVTGDGFPLYQEASGVTSIDEFLYFNTALYDYDIQVINSGFAADYISPVTGSGILYSTGITGYSTGLVPIFTGITGYGITGTGLFTNEFGVEYTGYATGALYANISGTGVVALTGEIQTADYYLGDGSIVINSGFLRNFYNSGYAFLQSTNINDNLEIIGEYERVNYININQYGNYDIVEDKFKIFESNPSIVFLDGLIKVSGNLINTGTFYSPAYALSGDFYNTGYYLDSLFSFNESGRLFTLGINTTIKLNNPTFSYTGGSPYTGSGVMSSNSLVFFSGKKLNSGQYQSSGGNLIIRESLYTGSTGRLIVVDISGLYSSTSGVYNRQYGGTNPYFSLVFNNGILLNKDKDYLSISPYSLLNHSGIFHKSNYSDLYNDLNTTDLFWKN